MILRVIDLAIEDRFAHREALGTWSPCRRLGRKCSRLSRCRDFLSPSQRLPVIHILITTANNGRHLNDVAVKKTDGSRVG